jgi:cytosine/adenosine deaminase-related metal-dependent hydrolase
MTSMACGSISDRSFTARWVFPVSGPPLHGGCVTVQGDRIVAVEPHPRADAVDLGDVAILPGLVNAHTHLEFSHCERPLGHAGMSLPDWIRGVVASRRMSTNDPVASIALGVAESWQSGTTTLGEIATAGWTETALAAAPFDVVAFYELIGLRAERVVERLEDAKQFVARARDASRWQGGISPHAPYSVHPELVVGLIRLATANQMPVAMHLAESREELELLSSGSGPFRALLEELGAWDPAAIPPGTRPLAFLQLLVEAPRSLVIHGNYLEPDELEFLAINSERTSVVYCPRTHAYFEHDRYPLARLLALGASVALGTDSRASNPDLSILAEMRFVARKFPTIAPAEVLRLGTLAGAKALGCHADAGTLDVGKLANLTMVAIPAGETGDPHELLWASELPVVETYHRGTLVRGGSL